MFDEVHAYYFLSSDPSELSILNFRDFVSIVTIFVRGGLETESSINTFAKC